MRFLADESCDFAVVRALREEGHDVLAVAEAARGAKDPEVVRLARDQGRVLLTEDKDFGWYVYASGEGGVGVVLIRFPAAARRLLAQRGSRGRAEPDRTPVAILHRDRARLCASESDSAARPPVLIRHAILTSLDATRDGASAAQTGSPAAGQYPALPSETPTRFEAATDTFDYVKRDVMIPITKLPSEMRRCTLKRNWTGARGRGGHHLPFR